MKPKFFSLLLLSEASESSGLAASIPVVAKILVLIKSLRVFIFFKVLFVLAFFADFKFAFLAFKIP